MKSLTWDRGQEMSAHKKFASDTKISVYFCDPSSPWKRGTNKNTNGLLRQYFPRGKDLTVFSQQDLDKIVEKLNNKPSKILDFRTPSEVFKEALH